MNMIRLRRIIGPCYHRSSVAAAAKSQHELISAAFDDVGIAAPVAKMALGKRPRGIRSVKA